MRSCNEHFNSKQKQDDGTYKQYYSKVDTDVMEIAEEKIRHLIEEGFDNEIITKDKYSAMDPADKGPG